MAKRKRTDVGTDIGETITSAPAQEADTHGIVVTTSEEPKSDIQVDPDMGTFPPVDTSVYDEMNDEDYDEESEEMPPPAVNPDIPLDPAATVVAALKAIGELYARAGDISVALSKHLRETASEPELHGFLQRMQITLGDFRHAVNGVEQSTSEYLREEIVRAFA